MYGYVVPDKSKIKNEEFLLFGAFYCGICKTMGRSFNQISRYTTNYDITFFAALICDQLSYGVDIKVEKCIGNPVRKKPVIQDNELLRRIADLNMLMSYYKAADGVADGDGLFKRAARGMLKKHYKNAAMREPVLDAAVRKMQERLCAVETRGESSPDIAADCFAAMLRDCAVTIAGDDRNLSGLVYNIGKFVYLADALDDVGDDFRKKRYNPLLACFGGYKNRRQFIESNYKELEFMFASTVNRAIECFNGMKFNQSYGLLENIVYYGLRSKTSELLSSVKKLKRPKL